MRLQLKLLLSAVMIPIQLFCINPRDISGWLRSSTAPWKEVFTELQMKARNLSTSTNSKLDNRNMFDDKENIIKKLIEKGPVSKEKRVYIIHGWRWHTASVIRDLGRFENKALKELTSKTEDSKMEDCFKFVIGFNWKYLMKIEKELWFPWLRRLLPSDAHFIMDYADSFHIKIGHLNEDLLKVCQLHSMKRNEESVVQIVGILRVMIQDLRELQRLQVYRF